jgi:hypothetical protein
MCHLHPWVGGGVFLKKTLHRFCVSNLGALNDLNENILFDKMHLKLINQAFKLTLWQLAGKTIPDVKM